MAIRCPLNGASAPATAWRVEVAARRGPGKKKRRSTSAAASTYSEEYSGSDMATHSPQPSASSVTDRSSRTSRLVWVPNEVRNGATSGIPMRRSSTPVSFIGPS